ncbi:hypothetical protein ACFPM3_14060 [Streptomyces coeruleoprunus]|uniref:Uncharacterized protein n=1 Tax=Streptomyces coeruleoprunus TaxID=285563 RepID=A0ABV9XGI1_9ACTN
MTRPSRTLLTAAALVASALWAAATPAAHAHGDGLKVDITGHASGRVEADVTWANDGDPVDERIAATVNAVSGDGRTALGPWRLVRAEGGAPARHTTTEALPPGRWKVTVEIGHPELGRAEKVLTVAPGAVAAPGATPGPAGTGPVAGPGAGPEGSRPTPAAAPPTRARALEASSPPASAAGDEGTATTTVVVVASALAAAVGAAGLLVARRNRRPVRPGAGSSGPRGR